MSDSAFFVEFLGNCANQTDDHEPVAFVVHAGDNDILVDTGPGIVRQIYRSGRHCSDFSTVLVTHCHGDHTAGFPYFIWSYFYESMQGYTPPPEITILGLPEVVTGLEATLRFCYRPDAWPFTVRFAAVEPVGRTEVAVGDCALTTVPVDHTVPTLGCRFDFAGRVVSYSCDTLYAPDFVDLARKSNLMIHEGFVTKDREELSKKTKHGTAREAGRAAREAQVDQLALVHFFPPYAGELTLLIDEARQEFSGAVFVPETFQRVTA
jgi:ribonuclease BN (tRNA processing enzyme)